MLHANFIRCWNYYYIDLLKEKWYYTEQIAYENLWIFRHEKMLKIYSDVN